MARLQLILTLALAGASQVTGVTVKKDGVMRSVVLSSNGVVQSGDDLTTQDWSRGSTSWQQAMKETLTDEANLWSQPNYCDSRVLHSSAPLTVLFGMSTFWEEIQQRYDETSSSTSPSKGKPLEIHVLGAAYPFEGRSDWSLLAKRRPPNVPSVRVVLVLGTPWHQDNVPVMDAKEFSEAHSFAELGWETPETGKVDRKDGEISCSGRSALVKEDQTFRKADLCRDHGNGLEVVCMEKYYQDVSAELPKPDVVVMFSPGFPQVARRSWDQVLTSLVKSDVPLMVCDLLSGDQSIFEEQRKLAGKNWTVQPSSNEDGMTLVGLNAYGARPIAARRNPFPIMIPQNKRQTDITGKNSVLQLFRGRLPGAKPWTMPSAAAIKERKKFMEGVDLKPFLEDDNNAEEIKRAFLMPTSSAYDEAMWKMYRGPAAEYLRYKMASKHWKQHSKDLGKHWHETVATMGLTGGKRETPWTLKEWIFLLTKLKFGDQVF